MNGQQACDTLAIISELAISSPYLEPTDVLEALGVSIEKKGDINYSVNYFLEFYETN